MLIIVLIATLGVAMDSFGACSIRLNGTALPYLCSFQKAYDSAAPGQMNYLQAQALDYPGDIGANHNVSATLQGGYNSTYSGQTGHSRICGSLTIGQGSLTIDRIILTSAKCDYRQAMRDFVQGISAYARSIKPGFIVIPQNGQELLTNNGEASGAPVTEYISAIDGVGREDLFYGYNEDNVATPIEDTNYMLAYLNVARNNGLKVLSIDYCSTHSYMDDSYLKNYEHGYISFAANHRGLDNIPNYPAQPYNHNTSNIASLADAKNFLYIINPSEYASGSAFITALDSTAYDMFVVDLFIDIETALTSSQVQTLQTKSGGQSRLAIAYMSIGEAEDYRYYWQPSWHVGSPAWLAAENPDWPGNYRVRYWDSGWQSIIFGNDESYLKKIIDAGFDGVYLDCIDSFEYFESN
jgi:cysteinyl-tRNA synthetase, unknown class